MSHKPKKKNRISSNMRKKTCLGADISGVMLSYSWYSKEMSEVYSCEPNKRMLMSAPGNLYRKKSF
jgi:hypothetical protein